MSEALINWKCEVKNSIKPQLEDLVEYMETDKSNDEDINIDVNNGQTQLLYASLAKMKLISTNFSSLFLSCDANLLSNLKGIEYYMLNHTLMKKNLFASLVNEMHTITSGDMLKLLTDDNNYLYKNKYSTQTISVSCTKTFVNGKIVNELKVNYYIILIN